MADEKMTDEQTVELLISPIREYISKVEAEAARFSDIAATIRVNALRRGASEDQIQALLTGEQSFIEWALSEIGSPATADVLAEAEARGRNVGLRMALDEIIKASRNTDSPNAIFELIRVRASIRSLMESLKGSDQ